MNTLVKILLGMILKFVVAMVYIGCFFSIMIFYNSGNYLWASISFIACAMYIAWGHTTLEKIF